MSVPAVTTDQIHKELELIQGVVKNMSANSFEVKKWLVGILTALFIFKSEELLGGKTKHIWLLLVPVLCFWYLDAFFLSTERFYREIYNWVVKNRPAISEHLYDLKTEKRRTTSGPDENLRKLDNSLLYSAFSHTVWPFYILPAVFIFVYAYSQ